MVNTSQHPIIHERRLGAIMIELKLLSSEKIEVILRTQSELDLPFGAIAVHLGLLTDEQLQQALFSQFGYPYLAKGTGDFSPHLIAAYEPGSSQVETLRTIRGELLLRWFTPNQRTLTVVSPDNGDGRSYISANLGVVFSQLGENTLLIDANLRAPRLHELFNLDNRVGLSSVLAGMMQGDAIQHVPQLKNLSVLVAGQPPPNPVELLAGSVCTELLQRLSTEYKIILIDTPAGLAFSETVMLTARAGGALTIARKHHTRLNDFRQLTETIRGVGAEVVGNVLNEI